MTFCKLYNEKGTLVSEKRFDIEIPGTKEKLLAFVQKYNPSQSGGMWSDPGYILDFVLDERAGTVVIVFLEVRKFGVKLVEVFFDIEKIKNLKFLQDEKRLDFITAVVFFLPGTPKDLLTYAVGLTDIKFSRFLLIVSVARFPSVITSTIGGSALGMANYKFAIIVFALTAVISLAGIAIYNYICRKKGKNE